MNLQDHLLIHSNAIDADTLARLDACMRTAERSVSAVSSFEGESQGDEPQWVLDTQVRDTRHLHLSAAMGAVVAELLRDIVRQYVEPFYGIEILDWEPPQILNYGVGGHYIAHADAETLYKDEEGLSLWEKTLDRDVSLVCFLNEDFRGGELTFPDFDLTLAAQAGTLVCFPSDHNYIHGVQPVTAGERYTLVTWMRVKGMPSPEQINEEVLAEYQRCWPEQVLQPPRVVKGGHPR